MSVLPLTTPVVLIIFNRPALATRVFAAIAKARPQQLFVIADGPRSPDERATCQAARSVIELIDWDCQLEIDFADRNLGCRKRIVSGLNWVFSKVDQAIVLEDDCVPHDSFFSYCESLLDLYKKNEQVMEIGGGNYQFGRRRTEYSYYFSKYSHTCGWATWRRAWQYFDESIIGWPQLKVSRSWGVMCDDPRERQYWESIYDSIFHGRFQTSWDYQWQLSRWRRNGLTAVPNVNLISNIGYGPEATHVRWQRDSLAQMPIHDIGELRHPPSVSRHEGADKYMFQTVFHRNLFIRMSRRARSLWKSSCGIH